MKDLANRSEKAVVEIDKEIYYAKFSTLAFNNINPNIIYWHND